MIIQRCLNLLTILTLLLAELSGSAKAVTTMARQNLSKCSYAQFAALYTAASRLPLKQRIAFWADLAAIDSICANDPLGEGAGHPPDTDPLNDFARVDCVTFVEQVYALALSADYKSFADTLRRIRYRDGNMDYRWRNHYFISDWLPANNWFVNDVTTEVGTDCLTSVKKTISRGKFFKEKGLPKYAHLPDEEATTEYIPRESVKKVAGKLQTGDIVIFVIDTPGIVAGHTGLIRIKNGTTFVQHASSTAKAVVTVPLPDYLVSLPSRFLGFKIARVYFPSLKKPSNGTNANTDKL